MKARTIELPVYDIVIEVNERGGGRIVSSQLDGPEFQGILRLVLAHTLIGINTAYPAYTIGITTAVEGIANEDL